MDLIPDLWDIEQIATIILPYVHSTLEMKYYTNHSRDHSRKLLAYIDEIIQICDLSEINLNEVEKSILKCACWLHDLGCIYDRDNHADESLKVIEILCEKGHLDLKAVKDESDLFYRNGGFHTTFFVCKRTEQKQHCALP